MMENNRTKGNQGESLAADFLFKNDFKIIARNFSSSTNFQGGEIDIIAKRGETIHFIEVKSRQSDKFGLGREAVTLAKQKIIRRLATLYLVQNGSCDTASCCFDVIEINSGAVEHFINCF